MERSLHHVADLGESARSAVEGLVGHPLGNDDVIYVASLGVQAGATPAERNEAWDEVEAVIAQMQQNAARSGLSSEQIAALIDAECAAVRYDRRT
jgi:hypothetical protein